MTDRLSGSTPDLADVIREALDSFSARIHTALPGTIKEWDPDYQTASVLPAVQASVRNLKGEHIFETLPLIYEVPVIFPRTLGGYQTFPIGVGDTGLLIFPEMDPGQWSYSNPAAEPKSAGDQRRHLLAGAVFLPGFYQRAHRITDYDGANVVIKPEGSAKVLIGGPTATDFAALSSKVEAELTKIKTAISGAAVFAGDGGATFKANIVAALTSSGMGATGSTAATMAKIL